MLLAVGGELGARWAVDFSDARPFDERKHFCYSVSGVSGAAQKCTSEEIAEKRRQAIERLKRRNQQNSSSTKKN